MGGIPNSRGSHFLVKGDFVCSGVRLNGSLLLIYLRRPLYLCIIYFIFTVILGQMERSVEE